MLLLAFALRLYGLDRQSIWDDEGFTVLRATMSLRELLASAPTGIQPLYYILLHFWIHGTGDSEFAYRFVSTWFGVALVPLTYVLGRHVGGRSTGLIAAALVACAPSFIYQSQNARAYTILTFFVTLHLYLTLRLFEKPGRLGLWSVWAASQLAALYLHLYPFLLLVPVNLILVTRSIRSRRAFLAHTAHQLLTLLAFVPWALVVSSSTIQVAGAKLLGDRPSPLRFAYETWGGFFVQSSYTLDADWTTLWWVPTLLGFLLGLATLLVHGRTQGVKLLGVVAVTVGLAYVVNLIVPYYNPRYLLFLAPSVAVIIGYHASLCWARRLVALPLLGLTMIFWAQPLHDYYQTIREDLPGLIREIAWAEQPGDLVVLNSDWRALDFQYYRNKESADSSIPVLVLPRPESNTPDQIHQEAREAAADRERIWLVTFGTAADDPYQPVATALSETYAKVSERWYGTTRLALYVRPDPASSEFQPSVVFGDVLQLVEYTWPSRGPLGPGDPLALRMRWRALETLPENYVVSLRLLDGEGRSWAQSDAGPHNGFMAHERLVQGEEIEEARGLTVSPGLPAGVYSLVIVVYNPSGGQLPVHRTPTTQPWEPFVLGHVAIKPTQWVPPLSTLDLEHPVDEQLASGLYLLGGSWPTAVTAGAGLQLDLYWGIMRSLSDNTQLKFSLLNGAGQMWEEAQSPLFSESGRRRSDPAVVRQKYNLRIKSDTPAGRYTLRATLVNGDEVNPPAGAGIRSIRLGVIEVSTRVRRQEPLELRQRISAVLGDSVELIGYGFGSLTGDEQPRLHGGESLDVLLYWRLASQLESAGRSVDESYAVFVQLLSPEGRLVAQDDGLPAGGEAPTQMWMAAETIIDRHTITLPERLSPGGYSLIAGLYNLRTMERLRLADGEDYVFLATLTAN